MKMSDLMSLVIWICFSVFIILSFRKLESYEQNEGGLLNFARSYNKFGL